MKRYFFLLFAFFLITTAAHASVILVALDGKKIPFDSLKGKWVLINYWASWCNTCLSEIKELNKFYLNNKNTIALFAINYDALPVEEQEEQIKQYHIRYPSLSEDPTSELHLGNIAGVPVTFVFNPQGKLSRVLYGGVTADALTQIVNS